MIVPLRDSGKDVTHEGARCPAAAAVATTPEFLNVANLGIAAGRFLVEDDMHNGSIGEGDVWLAKWLPPLLAWAEKHDTLIVLTWDEGFDLHNTIVTVFLGPMVRPGKYPERIDHVNVLRTLEDLYRLPHAGRSGEASPITDCWR